MKNEYLIQYGKFPSCIPFGEAAVSSELKMEYILLCKKRIEKNHGSRKRGKTQKNNVVIESENQVLVCTLCRNIY